jgi:hypothetical protein
MEQTDGPLFRGRFKAILVDADHYLAHLSRYIHLNPVTAKITETVQAYPWSSYPTYLRQRPAPAWLYQDTVLGQFGRRNPRHASRRHPLAQRRRGVKTTRNIAATRVSQGGPGGSAPAGPAL